MSTKPTAAELLNEYDKSVHEQSVQLSKGGIPLPMTALHKAALHQLYLAELERIGDAPFVSFESCRTAADYTERQNLRNYQAELRRRAAEFFGEEV